MCADNYSHANKRIQTVTLYAIALDLLLFIIKTIIGLVVGSIALVTDGIHSLSDLATDFAVLLGYHFGSKKADQRHPYGHGRIETFSAAFVAIVLIFVGSAAIYYSAMQVARETVTNYSHAVLVAAAFSIFAKEYLYRITKKVAVKFHSSALYANAWHHRSDAASSLAVFIGFIALRIGFKYGDQIAAIVVGLTIIYVASKIIGRCLSEFAESSVDKKTSEQIKHIISSNPSVRDWHKLRTRTVGREIFLDVHILVDAQLNIATAHEISEKLEQHLHDEIPRPVNIIIHMEPDMEARRQ
ncbi:MAG: cation diffusion facilitator family transporter [Planctomycetota bacterium]|jgi:cation diffusion facilitator family transporter